jgi:peptide/nickel transport system permease protein
MKRHAATLVVRAVVSIFVASLIVFLLVRASGDPVAVLSGGKVRQEDMARLRAAYGLDRPLIEQYWVFISHVAQGDFGQSLYYKRPALDLVLERFPATIQLVGLSLLLSLLVAIPLGVYSAVYHGGWLDGVARLFAALGQAVPSFWLGLMLILVFGVYLRVLPTGGSSTPTHIILPAVTIVWAISVGLMRLTRSSMLDVLGSEYIKLARIKGLPEYQVIWKHALKNAVLPVLTFSAILAINMINGAVVVETVFSWRGVGSLAVEAVHNRDFPVVQTVVIILSAAYAVSSLTVDILHGYVDPKVRSVR